MNAIPNYERSTDRSGRPVVLVPLETMEALYDRLEELEDIRDAEAVRARIRAGEEEIYSLEELKAKYGL